VLVYPDRPIYALIDKTGNRQNIVPFGAALKEVKRAIRVDKNQPLLAERLDKALKEFLDSPKYLKLYKKWHAYSPGYEYIKSISSASKPDYPPLALVSSNGKAEGFSVELMRAALKTMGKDVNFEVKQWSIIKDKLAKGEIDALPLGGKTPEREIVYDFTIPYIQLFGVVVVRSDEKNIKTPYDLKGKQIIVMEGDNAEEFIKRDGISDNIILTPTFEEALLQLSQGRGDAVIVQQLVAKELLKEMDLDNLKVIDTPLTNFRQDFCFAVQKGNSELLAILNEGLAIVKADGTYEKLHKKWFPFMYQ